MNPETIIPIGVIGGAHGLRGEVRLKLFNPASDLLKPGTRVVLQAPGGKTRPAVVAATRRANRNLLVAFEDIPDRTAAEGLTGTEVAVTRGEFPELEADEFYYEDVIGLPVRTTSGREVGRVSSVINGATDVLVIEGPGGEVMVPVVEGFVREVGKDDVVIEDDALESD